MTLEERRKEYLRDYVALKNIPTWMEDLKSKSEGDGKYNGGIFLKTTKFCFLGLKLLLGGPGVTTHDATNSGSQTRETRALLGQRGEKPQQNFLKPHWCWLILQVSSDRVIVILKPLHV